MAFDPAKTAALLLENGLPNSEVAKGVAIVEAESSHDPRVTHENDESSGEYAGSVDRGLWQINDKAHPEVTDEMAFDPVRATKEAVRIKGSGDYTAWSAYKNGAWKAHRKLGWVALRLALCQDSKDDWEQQFLLVNNQLDDALASGLDVSARLRVCEARVITLDQARLSAIQRLKNV